MAAVLRMLLLAATATSACAPVRPGIAWSELTYPMTTGTIGVGGIQVAYSDVGRGERTLLLVHGLASYMPAWSRNLPALSQSYRVVAIDLPGFGKSSKGDYSYSMEFYARVVDRVIEGLRLEHVVLVGHSMGAQIALVHALTFPGKAEALVLVAPAGFETFGPKEGAWLASASNPSWVKAATPEMVYQRMASMFYAMPDEAMFMVRDRTAVAGGPDFDAFAIAVWRSVCGMLNRPVLDRLHEIAVPVLATFGEADGLIPNPLLHGGTTRAVANQGMAHLRMGELVMIPRAGHMVQFEQPEAWNAAILDFLHRHPPRIAVK